MSHFQLISRPLFGPLFHRCCPGGCLLTAIPSYPLSDIGSSLIPSMSGNVIFSEVQIFLPDMIHVRLQWWWEILFSHFSSHQSKGAAAAWVGCSSASTVSNQYTDRSSDVDTQLETLFSLSIIDLSSLIGGGRRCSDMSSSVAGNFPSTAWRPLEYMIELFSYLGVSAGQFNRWLIAITWGVCFPNSCTDKQSINLFGSVFGCRYCLFSINLPFLRSRRYFFLQMINIPRAVIEENSPFHSFWLSVKL